MKIFLVLIFVSIAAVSCSKFDDSLLWKKIEDNASRIAKLESQVSDLNSNVTTLQSLVNALQAGDMISSVSELSDGSGIVITFTSGKSIVINHGKNGEDGRDGDDGKDGITPVISIRQAEDGIYYWTLNGDWILKENGEKLRVEGNNGKDGNDGNNGNDDVAPKFKIQDGYWYVSYDNERSWEKLGKATGDNGLNGDDGVSLIVSVEKKDSELVITLIDGNTISIPFEKKAPEGFTDMGLSVYWASSTSYNAVYCSSDISASYPRLSDAISTFPEGTRLPTQAEVEELLTNCVFSIAQKGGETGVLAQYDGQFVFFPDFAWNNPTRFFTSDKDSKGNRYMLSINTYQGTLSVSSGSSIYGYVWLVKDK